MSIAYLNFYFGVAKPVHCYVCGHGQCVKNAVVTVYCDQVPYCLVGWSVAGVLCKPYAHV